MKRVYELEVYQLAEELSDLVWRDFDRWNKKVQNTMGYQIIRSSDSIAANIAEGYGRWSGGQKKVFHIQEDRLRKLKHGYENLLRGRL
ncbi:MAG: four helix bundle protein [Candidatus Marinimicrobia bacterium]|nr:four helix bundle protein [Candidatus Neomarinimicrobiota bacterium]